MRKSAIAACVVTLLGITRLAAAADATPVDNSAAGYVGVDAGWIGYHDNVSGDSVDLSGFTYSPFLGYQFNRYVAVEGSYIGTGPASTNVSGVDVDVKSHAVEAALLGTLPLSPVGGIYGRLGLARWHATATATVPGTTSSASTDGTDGIYGLGAYFTNGQQLSGRFEVDTASINGTRIYRVTLGAYWSFR